MNLLNKVNMQNKTGYTTPEDKIRVKELSVTFNILCKEVSKLTKSSFLDIKSVVSKAASIIFEDIMSGKTAYFKGLFELRVEKRKPKRHWDNVKRQMVITEGKYCLKPELDSDLRKEIESYTDFERIFEEHKHIYESKAVLNQQKRLQNGKNEVNKI